VLDRARQVGEVLGEASDHLVFGPATHACVKLMRKGSSRASHKEKG